MSEEQARSLLTLAGLEPKRLWALIDGYGYRPDDHRFFETPPRQVWWLAQTRIGLIEVGWRKRVIHIDWQETPIRRIVTDDHVTKGDTFVHAWSFDAALKYLVELGKDPA